MQMTNELSNTSNYTLDDHSGLDDLLPDPVRDLVGGYGQLKGNTVWEAALNGSEEAIHDAPENVTRLADQVSRIRNNFYTQFFNNALRDRNATDNVTPAPGRLVDDNRQRLFQEGTSTRILEAPLLKMWFCTTLAYSISSSTPRNSYPQALVV